MSKSDTSYTDPALRALFRMNNHSFVITALRRTSLMELLLLAEPNAEKTYQDLLIKEKNNYVLATFAKAKAYLEQASDEPGMYFVLIIFLHLKFAKNNVKYYAVAKAIFVIQFVCRCQNNLVK